MRDNLRQAFLDQHGMGDVECPLLAGDASFRKYYRLEKDGETRVLMDAPPPEEDVKPFIKVAKILENAGLSAPHIYHEDCENGFLLLEDLGDNTYTRLLQKGYDEKALYDLAIDALIHLHHLEEDHFKDLPPYDLNVLEREILLFYDWWMKAVFGDVAITDQGRKSYLEAWKDALTSLQDETPALVLRDYHVDNLLLLEERDGVQACGLLDFQDALSGSALYDVMSLLEDARRDIDDALIEGLKQKYMDAFSQWKRDHFDRVFAILGAQRHAKVIGIFVRLKMRDDKDVYLQHIPRVWRLFERSLQHPALSSVKKWVDEHVPAEKRGIPECYQK